MPPKPQQTKKPTTNTAAPPQAPEPWQTYLPKTKPLNDLITGLHQQQSASILKYMADPTSHPDITAAENVTKYAVSTKGKVPVAKATTYRHVDGFDNAPLYQSPAIHVETNMTTRIGGRGIVATQDILPGTLLLCEYIRHPFQRGLVADDGVTPIRSEIEFLQEYCFDFTPQQQQELLHDFEPLFPFTVDQIEPDHKEFLLGVYGELIEQCVQHCDEMRDARQARKATGKKGSVSAATSTTTTTLTTSPTQSVYVTKDILLRLICLVHFNSFPSGFLLHHAMVNHCCLPNATKLFISRQEIDRANKHSARTQRSALHKGVYQPKSLEHRSYNELRSTRFIKKGEEIFISYIPQDLANLTVQQRQVYLYRQFRFHCDCATCANELQLLKSASHEDATQEEPRVEDADENQKLVLSEDKQKLQSEEDWIDELSYNYINLTKAKDLPEFQDPSTMTTPLGDDQKSSGVKGEGDNEEDGEDVENENAIITDFREKYGLPADLSIQVFIMLQTVAILYPLLAERHVTSTDAILNNNKKRLATKCHKLITMISKEVLEQLSQDVTVDNISLLLYMYMLQNTAPSQQHNNTNKKPNKALLPWNNLIQLSSMAIDHYTILEEVDDAEAGLELTSNNSNGTKYKLKLTKEAQHYNVVNHEVQPVNGNWTLDLFLKQFFVEMGQLINPHDIITPTPQLDPITPTSQPQLADYVAGVVGDQDEQEQGQTGKQYIFTKLLQLLDCLKPASTLLLNHYTDRVMSTLHLTISFIGLISSIYELEACIQHNKVNDFSQFTTIPPHLKFKLPLSTVYNDLVFSTAYYLQNILPHNAYASKVLRLPLLQELIGKTPAEANKFEEQAMNVHRLICELYNQCPIESIVKGV